MSNESRGIVFTVVTRNHLPYARVLMASVEAHLPAAERHVLIVDAERASVAGLQERFLITTGAELGLRGFRKRAFLNSAGGLCCLFKPIFAKTLLQRSDVSYAIYADADSRFYSRPDALLTAVHSAPLVIIPHTLGPIPHGGITTDGAVARGGTYNAGLFAVRNDRDGQRIIDLWSTGMWRDAWLDHRFAWDQIWLPLLRHYLPSTLVLSEPEYDVAYWNTWERTVEVANGEYIVGRESPLVHFHFSFFDRSRPEYLVNRWSFVLKAETVALAQLCRDYATALATADFDCSFSQPYGFGRFSDGQGVTEMHREYYRTKVAAAGSEDDDPFATDFAVGTFVGSRRVHEYLTRRARALRAWHQLCYRVGARFR